MRYECIKLKKQLFFFLRINQINDYENYFKAGLILITLISAVLCRSQGYKKSQCDRKRNADCDGRNEKLQCYILFNGILWIENCHGINGQEMFA
jgi:hypothetical protein